MKNFIVPVLILALPIFNISCTESTENTPPVPQEIISKSQDLFDGEVIEKQIENEEGIDSWEIKIKNAQGAIVQFYWVVSNQNLLKIKGDQGPFAYEINPGNGLITYSTAKTLAISAVKNEAIQKWELKQNDDFIDKWVYEFEIDDSDDSLKVYIDAENGDILQID